MMTKKKFFIFFVAAFLAVCIMLPVFSGCGTPIASIKVSTKPTKIDYVVGQTLDLAGMAVTAKLEDDSEKELSSDEYTVTPAAGTVLKETDTTITVAYGSGTGALSTTFTIKVHNKVTSLAIKTPPTKTSYWAGEEKFDPEGMVLTATRENEATEEVTVKGNAKVTVEDRTLSTEGDADEEQTIGITFGEKTYQQAISVKANPVMALELKTEQTKKEYFVGEKFNPAGIVLSATYKSETIVDIVSTDTGLTYHTKPLTAADGTVGHVEVSFGGKKVNAPVKVIEGLFLEAESGIIKSSGGKVFTDSLVDTDGDGEKENTATGGKYLGDLKADDTVDFDFMADKAGTVKFKFRMASQYLKDDDNWQPIWMGDCQFNKICKVYVNDVEYDIPDSIVLLGGGEEGGEIDSTLWFNWQDVNFPDITVDKGYNAIRLEFIEHDYMDTSQESFAGKFTANLDSLVLLPADSGINFETITFEAKIDNEFITYEEKPEGQTEGEYKLGEDGKYVVASTKSLYTNHKSIWAKDADHRGGKIDGFNGWGAMDNNGDYVEYIVYMSEAGKADIDWLCSSAAWSNDVGGNTPTPDIGEVAILSVNGRGMDIDGLEYPVKDPGDWTNYQHTVVKDIDLVKGKNTIRMTRTGGHGMNQSRIEIFAEKAYATFESIEIDSTKGVTEYAIGQKFTTKGLKVTAIFAGDIKATINANALEFEDKELTETDTKVTVSYTIDGVTKTKEIEITVTEDGPVVSIEVIKLPDKLVYADGEAFDKTGMEVVKRYAGGKTEAVTDFTAEMADGVVTVTVGTFTTTFEVEISTPDAT